jgi:hypothetical protein
MDDVGSDHALIQNSHTSSDVSMHDAEGDDNMFELDPELESDAESDSVSPFGHNPSHRPHYALRPACCLLQ